jgi:hypothetical protein
MLRYNVINVVKFLHSIQHRIIVVPECDCGNKNTGSCIHDWTNGKYGDFTLVKECIREMCINF